MSAPDKSLILELNNLNGEYQLSVDGLLHVYSNINYSNVIFDNIQFVNNANIIGTLQIFNNMMVAGVDSNIVATSMYSVTTPDANAGAYVDQWTSNTAVWASNNVGNTDDPLQLQYIYCENIFNTLYFGSIIDCTRTITGSNIIIKSANATHSYSLSEELIPVEFPGVPQTQQSALLLNYRNDAISDTSGTSHWFYQSGLAFRKDSQTSWNVFSDARLKTDVKTLDNGLDTLCRLRPIYFKWKDKISRGSQINSGFIAQEYVETLPNQVHRVHLYSETEKKLIQDDTCLSISYDLNPYIVSAIRELYKMVTDLQTYNAKLEQEIASLKKKHRSHCWGPSSPCAK